MTHKIWILAIVSLIAVVSCKKSSSSSSTTPTATGFVWSENGGANITADSAYYTLGTGGSTQSYMYAYKIGGTPRKFLEINLNAQTASAYNIPSQGDFVYWQDTTATLGSGGSLTVTANTGGKASGTFDITFTSGSVTHVKGTFTNIPIK